MNCVNPDKIGRFEKLGVPVDMYGVGTALLSNCTESGANPHLEPISRLDKTGRVLLTGGSLGSYYGGARVLLRAGWEGLVSFARCAVRT